MGVVFTAVLLFTAAYVFGYVENATGITLHGGSLSCQSSQFDFALPLHGSGSADPLELRDGMWWKS